MEKCIGEKRPESEPSKTEYLKVGGADVGEEFKLQRDVVKRVKIFKYFGSTVSSGGRCEEGVRRRVQAG